MSSPLLAKLEHPSSTKKAVRVTARELLAWLGEDIMIRLPYMDAPLYLLEIKEIEDTDFIKMKLSGSLSEIFPMWFTLFHTTPVKIQRVP